LAEVAGDLAVVGDKMDARFSLRSQDCTLFQDLLPEFASFLGITWVVFTIMRNSLWACAKFAPGASGGGNPPTIVSSDELPQKYVIMKERILVQPSEQLLLVHFGESDPFPSLVE